MSNTTANAAPVTTIRTFTQEGTAGVLKMSWNPKTMFLAVSRDCGHEQDVLFRVLEFSVENARQSWNHLQAEYGKQGWIPAKTYTVKAR